MTRGPGAGRHGGPSSTIVATAPAESGPGRPAAALAVGPPLPSYGAAWPRRPGPGSRCRCWSTSPTHEVEYPARNDAIELRPIAEALELDVDAAEVELAPAPAAAF